MHIVGSSYPALSLKLSQVAKRRCILVIPERNALNSCETKRANIIINTPMDMVFIIILSCKARSDGNLTGGSLTTIQYSIIHVPEDR